MQIYFSKSIDPNKSEHPSHTLTQSTVAGNYTEVYSCEGIVSLEIQAEKVVACHELVWEKCQLSQ